MLRSGARTRDALYVTGALGGACLPGARRHLLFEPRLAAGRFLAEGKFASAMLDISDGLAADLPRLLDASRRGVRLDAAAIPLSRAARKTDAPLHHALCDGEDFELLFTVAPQKIDCFETAWKRRFPKLPATRIGTILASPRQRYMRDADGTTNPLPPGGYQHFLPKITS